MTLVMYRAAMTDRAEKIPDRSLCKPLSHGRIGELVTWNMNHAIVEIPVPPQPPSVQHQLTRASHANHSTPIAPR